MKTFTITEAKSKSHQGKVVTILETKEDLVLVKMGRTNFEILLDFKYLECDENETPYMVTQQGERLKKVRKTLEDVLSSYFTMYKINANKARAGVMVYSVTPN